MPSFGVSVQLGTPVPPPLLFVKQIDWDQANPPQLVPWLRHIKAQALTFAAGPPKPLSEMPKSWQSSPGYSVKYDSSGGGDGGGGGAGGG